jgi:hypothetical protein
MHAADPVPARSDFPVRHGKEIFAERRAKSFKHLLWGVERNAANEMELTSHGMSFAS